MPRVSTSNAPSRGGSRAGVLAIQEDAGISRKKSMNQSQPRQTRAALGEITNASKGSQEEAGKKISLKSQVKKGLTNIVRRKSSAAKTLQQNAIIKSSSQENPPQALVTAPNHTGHQSLLDKLPQRTVSNTSSVNSSPRLFNLQLSFDSSGNSLPSSQEEESVRKLQEKLSQDKELLELSGTSSTLSSDDSYHSASASPQEEPSRPLVNHRYVPPARVLPPTGVFDFDADNAADPSACSEYAQDIFQYYKEREAQFEVPDYLSQQPQITEMMRSILVDWLVEVQESFELNHETLYTAIKLMDIFMSKKFVCKEDLQLVGATAALIACKTDERIPPNLDDFVYVCDDAYTRKDIVRKELEMVSVVGYDVGYPLSYRFLRRFGRVCRVNMPDLTFARYILELSLMEYALQVETSESLLAAAVLYVALKIRAVKGWKHAFLFYTGFTLEDIRPLAKKVLDMLKRPANEHLRTIRQKYDHGVFFEVAKIEIPRDLDCWDCLDCVE